MKINAISQAYVNPNLRLKNSAQPDSVVKTENMQTISFRGGNKNQVMHIVAEMPPYFKKGGVATVANDYKTLTPNADTTMVLPYYNGKVSYDKSGSMVTGVDVLRVPNNLPEGHALKGKEGTPFFTNQNLDKVSIDDILKDPKKYVLLEEVESKTMTWGLEEKAPIKLFKVPNTNHFMVYTEATASMAEPYKGGGYATSSKPFAASWGGDPYAKFDKATVELMESITKKMPNYDPGTVVCSDSHAAYVTHWMAVKNANGEEFFKGKKPTQIGHNLGGGYIGETSPRNMLVNLGATKEQIEKILNSAEYFEALKSGSEDAYFKKFLAPVIDGNKGVNAMEIPIYYAKKDYLPMFTTVSEGYYKTLLENPNIAPALQEGLIEIDKLGKFKGLTNPLNDPNVSAFKQLGLPGYGKEADVKLADGTSVKVKPFEVFDKAKSENLKYVRDIKNKNKINLFERLSGKFEGCDKHGLVIAGLDGKQVKVHGNIDKSFIDKINKGEDVKLMVSWGRGDFQKAMDTVIDTFEKYVNKTNDSNAVLVMGGELNPETPDYKVITDKIQKLNNDPKFKGRFVYMDGFAPGLPLSSAADLAVLPSRTAPCELTDFEAKKMLCPTAVTNCQGLGQKNFDPDNVNEAQFADSFKTKHEYFMSEKECLADGVASDSAKAKFLKLKNKIEADEKLKYKLRTGNDISEKLLQEKVQAHKDYAPALKELRDSIISDELANCVDRAFNKYRNGDVAEKINKNLVNIETSWSTNGWLSETKKSSQELYKSLHFDKDAKNIAKKDLLSLDINNVGESISNKARSVMNFGGRKGKMAAGVAIVTAALAGLGYLGYKSGLLSPKFEEEKKNGNLSRVV